MKPSECLRRAALLINSTDKWCQHRPTDGKGRRDLLCALIEVDQPTAHEACNYVRKVLGPGVEVGLWHDDPTRTHFEVLDVVARAAALAELKGA